MRSDRCARLWELEPYREGRLGAKDARSFERHLQTCPACRGQLGADEQLRRLARALPREEPSELALRRLRTRVLRDAAAGIGPRPAAARWRTALPAAVVAAALAASVLLVFRRAEPVLGPVATVPLLPVYAAALPEDMAGSVVASPGARWSQARTQGVERVALDDGALRVHVRPQVAGERFLVALPDGELEVRGTTFEVTVEGGTTTQVHVEEGAVELRLAGRPPGRLQASDTWAREAAPSGPAPSATPGRPVRLPSQARASSVEDAAAYTAALALLRAGRNDEAAAAFHAFALSQPRAPQTEDASFLEAVALARAGRSDAAALAAEHHLASYPGSFHREEASVLVARAAAQRGDCVRARAVLAAWVGDAGGKMDADALAALRPCQTR